MKLRRILLAVLAAAAVLAVTVLGGWWILKARAAGGGAVIEPAQVPFSPGAIASPSPGVTATPAPTQTAIEHRQQWTAARVLKTVTVRALPERSSPVRLTLAGRTRYGAPTVLLVRQARTADAGLWYEVSLPVSPNGSRGWVRARGLSLYQVRSKIVVYRKKRYLEVVRNGEAIAGFPIAVGIPSLPTPAGSFYVTEKVRPTEQNGPYGVLAIGISAFQPKLSHWPGDGQVAIHGTNQPQLIGQAVSHGCIRMKNEDVLELSRLAPVGSPVIIR